MVELVAHHNNGLLRLEHKEKGKFMRFTPKDLTNNLVLPLWNDKSLDVVDNFLTPNADIRTTFLTGRGPETLKKSVQDTFDAFPSFEIKVEDVIHQDNKLMYKWQAKARHEGNILGLPGTGQETLFSGMVFGELEDGKICVYHSFSNIPQILQTICNEQSTIAVNSLDVAGELRRTTDIPLTKREVECLCLWVRGCSIKESAKQMGGLSERTIQTYRENIKQKFQAKNFQKLLGIIQQTGAMPLLLGGSL